MGLVTRQGKGSKLTVQEMDGNLEYLRGSYKVNTNGYIDWSEASMQEFNVVDDVDFDFVGAVAGQELTLLLNQSSGNVGWTSSVKWVNDVVPVITNGDVKLDTSFVTGTGFNDFVRSIVLQSDERILVGGGFDEYNGVSVVRIARLNTNGTLDNTFLTGTGFNDNVFTMTLQSDGKILVGGGFTEYNGVSVGYIARLNSNGTLDNTFLTGTGFNDSVYSITEQSDGKILVGGFFNEYNGVSVGRIARLNLDGSLDTTFLTGTGFNSPVLTITLQSDGKILVGGFFNEYNGVSVGYGMTRLNTNGSLDTSFVTVTGFNDNVYSMTLQSDGKILVGGSFNEYNGQSVGRLVRLNTNGSLNDTFVTGTGFNGYIFTITLQSDGKILVGGSFTEYDGVSVGCLVRLNSNGSLDTTFDTGTGFNDNVFTMTFQSDGKILVGGEFNNYNGQSIGYGVTRLSQLPTYKVVKFYYNGVDYIGESINQI